MRLAGTPQLIVSRRHLPGMSFVLNRIEQVTMGQFWIPALCFLRNTTAVYLTEETPRKGETKILEGKRPLYEIDSLKEMGKIGTQSIIRRIISKEKETIIFRCV